MESSLLTSIVNSRITFLVVLVFGMALCSQGIGKAAAQGLWLHPISFAGYLLGAAALLIGLQGLFGWNVLPVSNGVALALIGAIVLIKVVLAALYPGAVPAL